MRDPSTAHRRRRLAAAAVAGLSALGLAAPTAAAQTSPPLGYTPVEFTPPSGAAAPAAPVAPAAPAATPPSAAAPRPAAPPAAQSELGPGAQGEAVRALEQRLADLKYFPGAVDGVYDPDTAYAVTAYQKANGMGRTGVATPDVINSVTSTTSPPAAMVPGGGPNRVEIDLNRQILQLYEGDGLVAILPVSTGSGERFCSGGWCRRAVTNPGTFKVYRRGVGWETGALGSLYNPLYFDGGIAIHGSKSVPVQPASHGCVRIPMSAAEWVPNHVPNGTPVYVLGG